MPLSDLPEPPADLLKNAVDAVVIPVEPTAEPVTAEPVTPEPVATPAPVAAEPVAAEPVVAEEPAEPSEPAPEPAAPAEPAEPAPAPAPAAPVAAPVAVDSHDHAADVAAAQNEWKQAQEAEVKAREQLKAARAAINAISDDDLVDGKLTKAREAAQQAIEDAQAAKAAATDKYNAASQNHQQQQQQTVQNQRQAWATANPDIPLTKADEVYAAAYADAASRYPRASADTLAILANERFEQKLLAIRSGAKAHAKPAAVAIGKPPVTKAGGSVLPVGAAAARPPAPKPLTVAERLEKELGPVGKHFQ